MLIVIDLKCILTKAKDLGGVSEITGLFYKCPILTEPLNR